jgi:N-methylhydantoinase B
MIAPSLTPADSVTTEIVQNLFISAAEEMKGNLMRTAYNPVVFENCDFAVALSIVRLT